ncbi:peptidoglycan DD-metalloendopeptidase family protein [Phytohabitans sp. ZYX-F-186]|uniref:Peptidoglycan DD-metalloendopeptidase family protein n=1 Tax=Phytohabitans maris TaxID=3071409 RepID=A0ABU0ZVC7_9ACTN|nr:peptidoglycan DD-metalloendopeptidase family protein [Phytohabitans sp. ZYX-F-186]MDQ7910991.1 peptidoglycan DD-metalloendopeptidase family protein [Phytohabitans sp. ZYX-F-186]
MAKDKKRVDELTAKLDEDRKRLAAMAVETQVRRELVAREARQLYIGATTSLSARPTDPTAISADAVAQLATQERAAESLAQAVAAKERDLDAAKKQLDADTEKLKEAKASVAALKQRVDSDVRETILSAQEAADDVARLGDGRLGMPVEGRRTSPFGNRFDPFYHRWQLHAGVDIAAPMGKPIRAAADGVVTQSGWNGGYGNYTCINHGQYDGKRLSTCYAHQSKILVSTGQKVKAGQVIGLIGSTGASTGPHLHFEVRIGGRPVDPTPWL